MRESRTEQTPDKLYCEKKAYAGKVISFAEALEFDLIGIDASMANAFRRILLNEVLTLLACVVCALCVSVCIAYVSVVCTCIVCVCMCVIQTTK